MAYRLVTLVDSLGVGDVGTVVNPRSLTVNGAQTGIRFIDGVAQCVLSPGQVVAGARCDNRPGAIPMIKTVEAVVDEQASATLMACSSVTRSCSSTSRPGVLG